MTTFRQLAVGQAFKFTSEETLGWQGARGPWIKTGARSYRFVQDGYANGLTHVVGTVNVLVIEVAS